MLNKPSKTKPLSSGSRLYLHGHPSNDLFKLLKQRASPSFIFYSTPWEAVEKAAPESVVMILATSYPSRLTAVDQSLFLKAKEKNLSLYVEFPAWLPALTMEPPR
jgi:hypothetical protein